MEKGANKNRAKGILASYILMEILGSCQIIILPLGRA